MCIEESTSKGIESEEEIKKIESEVGDSLKVMQSITLPDESSLDENK